MESVAFGPVIGDERKLSWPACFPASPPGGSATAAAPRASCGGTRRRRSSASPPTSTATSTRRCWSATASRSSPTTRAGATSTRSTPTAADLRRHTDHGADGAPAFYARHAATDGNRVVYESAGQLWLLPTSTPRPSNSRFPWGQPRRPADGTPLKPSRHLGDVVPDRTGGSSAVEAHGTLHWLRHKDGPSRVLEATPGVRPACPVPSARAGSPTSQITTASRHCT